MDIFTKHFYRNPNIDLNWFGMCQPEMTVLGKPP